MEWTYWLLPLDTFMFGLALGFYLTGRRFLRHLNDAQDALVRSVKINEELYEVARRYALIEEPREETRH